MDKQSLNKNQFTALTELTSAQLRDIIGMFVANPNASLTRGELGEILQAILQVAVDGGGGGGGGAVEVAAPITGDGSALTPVGLADSGVTTVKLADNAVTTNKINNLAVVEGKIGASAVTSSKISDLAVTSGKISNLAVTNSKIADNAVTSSKIADNAVTNTKVPNGELTLAKLAQSGASLNQVPKWNGSAWAPGDDNSGGGGGLPQVYDAGNGCLVAASGPGVEFGISPGIGLISVPEGVIVYSAFVQGDLDDLLSNNIDIALGWTSGTPPFNANLASIFPPTVTKYNRITSNGNPGTDPWIMDVDNTPLLAVSGVNPIKIRGINMNGITYWGLRIDFI